MYLFELDYVVYYALALIIGPLLYFGVKLQTAKEKKEFHHLRMILKLIFCFGIVSIAVIVYNLKLSHA